METGYKVCDAMTRLPIVVSPETNLEDCAKKMAENKVGSLLIKEKDKLLGIITDADMVRRVLAKGIDPKITKVKEVMNTELTTISPEKDIFDALMLMKDKDIRQLPVMDGKKMVGLLTMKDILKIEPQLFDLLVEKMDIREEANKPISRVSSSEGICQECGEYSDDLINVKGIRLCGKCR